MNHFLKDNIVIVLTTFTITVFAAGYLVGKFHTEVFPDCEKVASRCTVLVASWTGTWRGYWDSNRNDIEHYLKFEDHGMRPLGVTHNVTGYYQYEAQSDQAQRIGQLDGQIEGGIYVGTWIEYRERVDPTNEVCRGRFAIVLTHDGQHFYGQYRWETPCNGEGMAWPAKAWRGKRIL